jgi:hypothetical protein
MSEPLKDVIEMFDTNCNAYLLVGRGADDGKLMAIASIPDEITAEFADVLREILRKLQPN